MNPLLLNGRPVPQDALSALALVNYGHFTSMQVRGGCVQGLALHRQRLESATLELFGSELDFGIVREHMREALAGQDDGSLRVTVFSSGFDYRQPARSCAVDVLVSTTPPASAVPPPVRVRSCVFARTLPHIKHVGTFPLFHHRRLAVQAGYDDALFVDACGVISEGTVWNVGFMHDGVVSWPNAPALGGTAAQLLQQALEGRGTPQRVREVRLDDLAGFSASFACNAAGIWPIDAIDRTAFGSSGRGVSSLREALDALAWDPI